MMYCIVPRFVRHLHYISSARTRSPRRVAGCPWTQGGRDAGVAGHGAAEAGRAHACGACALSVVRECARLKAAVTGRDTAVTVLVQPWPIVTRP